MSKNKRSSQTAIPLFLFIDGFKLFFVLLFLCKSFECILVWIEFIVYAQALGTVFTLEIFVCIFRKVLWVATVGNFPNQKHSECKGKKHVVQNGSRLENEENKWGEHHLVIPIINTAGVAAFVFHHPRLERTEEHNAN